MANSEFGLSNGAVFGGRYKVERLIKAGGMGAVYEVSHIETLGQLALKVMLPQVVSNADLRARFQLEAKATAQIRSDHVVKVWDTGVDAETGLPFLVMELLKGEDLGALLARRGSPLPATEVLELLDQARHGLDKIHAADVVHRDITPQNLFRTERDDHSPCLKIIDFGIAKVVDESTYPRTTCGFGTRLYAAPEQLLGAGTIGSGADLYSLAHVAFTLLSGQAYWEPEHVLFAGGYQFVQRVLGGTKIPGSKRAGNCLSGFAKEFDRWFARATALDPAERFETASELVEELFAVFEVPAPRRREAQPDFTQAAEAPIAGADPALVEDDAQLSQSRTSTAAVAASAQVQSRRRRHVYPFVAGAALAMAIAGVLLSVGRPAAESPRAASSAPSALIGQSPPQPSAEVLGGPRSATPPVVAERPPDAGLTSRPQSIPPAEHRRAAPGPPAVSSSRQPQKAVNLPQSETRSARGTPSLTPSPTLSDPTDIR